MTSYEITYIRTGSGEKKTTDKVWVSTYDKRRDGTPVSNIFDAIDLFEELAAEWGSYENKNAIVNIRVKES